MTLGGAAALAAILAALNASSAAPEDPTPSFRGQPIDAVFCTTVWDVFAEAMATMPGDSARVAPIFEARADRIRAQMIADEGGDETAEAIVDVELAAAYAAFDTEAFDALEEAEAEAIMTWCENLAGPDE